MNSPASNPPIDSNGGDSAAVDSKVDSKAVNSVVGDADTSNSALDNSAAGLMQAIDDQIAHVWMVRTFLKHSDEAAEDEELASVHRDLYDFMLALGPALDAQDAAAYLKLARKKLGKIRNANALLLEIQPEVSGHTNFKMATRSLQLAVGRIEQLLASHGKCLTN